jgi:hypothetical protein
MEPTKNAVQSGETNLGSRTAESPTELLTLSLIALLVGAAAGSRERRCGLRLSTPIDCETH